MSQEPKFKFMPTMRRYGKLDISDELIVCSVRDGWLSPHGQNAYPKSWEDAVKAVGTVAEYERIKAFAEETHTAEYKEKYPKNHPTPVPTKTLLLGLNDDKNAFEVVYDPHGLAADVDPMGLLNFRRKL